VTRMPPSSRKLCRGEYSAHRVDEATGRWGPALFTRPNLILYSWGYLACQALGAGNPAFKVAAAYLEYKNVINPTDQVPVPGFDRAGGLSYYSSLPANQDFLRVPLAGTPAIDIAPGSENYFVAGVSGNRATFSAQSAGATGNLGRPFSTAANSKLFGIALVATPVLGDWTHDVLLSRGYFAPSDQQLKTAGSQLGVRWAITFG